MPQDVRPRILYIDAYDSFANNIVSLVQAATREDVEVQVIKHDDPRFTSQHHFSTFIHYFDAVIAGPGPGDPRNDEDIGVIRFLWSLKDDIPTLGICLGFQSMCHAFGGTVEKLKEPRHGLVRLVKHIGDDVFNNTRDFYVTSYHSLHVKLDTRKVKSEILPLAWDHSDHLNGEVLMAARHISRPIWGVQYHPESICTDLEGQKIISAWWNEAVKYNLASKRRIDQSPIPPPSQQTVDSSHHAESIRLADAHVALLRGRGILDASQKSNWIACHSPKLDISRLCDALDFSTSQSILLKSGRSPGHPLIENLGRFSVIGIVHDIDVLKLQYQVDQKVLSLTLEHPGQKTSPEIITSSSVSNVWSYIKRFMDQVKVKDGPKAIPFWGGLVGYISYEAGLESISVDVPSTMQSASPHNAQRPDICFVFVEQSIVVDHLTDMVYIQSLRNVDNADWQRSMVDKVHQASALRSHIIMNGANVNVMVSYVKLPAVKKDQSQIRVPEKSQYLDKISICDRHIRDGDSYELCLTDQTIIYSNTSKRNNKESGWMRFKSLAIKNPAPFSAYIRLEGSSDGLTILGSSPERFLKWSREGTCQFRPIKGTVKKGPDVTYGDAAKILNSSKEQAENLMITDLIRHDLHGVVGSGNVSVPKLMQIEEYATMYQLVSVVEGTGLKTETSNNDLPTGIDILSVSLPPGSMTGAPKKRSCELLGVIEQEKPRGLYSGVIGYLDVGGGGDFSVVIRTAYRWDSDTEPLHSNGQTDGATSNESFVEKWTVGAGGAITAQSDAEDEHREMITKLNSVLGAFNTEE